MKKILLGIFVVIFFIAMSAECFALALWAKEKFETSFVSISFFLISIGIIIFLIYLNFKYFKKNKIIKSIIIITLSVILWAHIFNELNQLIFLKFK